MHKVYSEGIMPSKIGANQKKWPEYKKYNDLKKQ